MSEPGSPRLALDDGFARGFVVAALAWGALGLAAGALVAVALALPGLELPPALAAGRLAPLHGLLAGLGLVANLIFAAIHWSAPRLLRARPPAAAAGLHLWGWQAVVVALVASAALGGTGAADAWHVTLAPLVPWIGLAGALAAMIVRRGVARIAPAVGFYLLATLALPVAWLAGHRADGLGGIAGALLGGWAREALAVFLFAVPLFGAIHHLAPVLAGRPLWSYPLAVAQLWGLALLGAWGAGLGLLGGPVHDHAQALVLVGALLAAAPALAGVILGLGTIGLDAPAREPALRFLVVALLAHGLAAGLAPLLALDAAAPLGGTDAASALGHLRGLGWLGLGAAGVAYALTPRLWGAPLRWRRLADLHLYLAVVATLLQLAGQAIAALTQAAMWRAQRPAGGLRYDFAESLAALDVPYALRAVGGLLYLAGFVLMLVNLVATMRRGRAIDGEVAPGPVPPPPGLATLVLAGPPLLAAALLGLVLLAGWLEPLAATTALLVAALIAIAVAVVLALGGRAGAWHRRLERHGLALAALLAVAVVFDVGVAHNPLAADDEPPGRAPTGAAARAGRAVYLREGCPTCHTQIVRAYLWETARYGEVTAAAEAADRPALWGARRLGPDLARVGARRDAAWLRAHLLEPRAAAPASRMPSYRHLDDAALTALVAYLAELR